MKKGYVRSSHLFYIIIIAIIVLAFFLVIAFGGSKSASTTMGTASTVSSLILSVIAIVMTIVDVSGQRDTVGDLKESAEKLESSLITVNNGIDEIREIKEEMLNSMSQINKSNVLLGQEIAEMKEKYSKVADGSQPSNESKDIIKDLDQLSEKINRVFVQSENGRYGYFRTIPNNSSIIDKNFSQMFRNALKNSIRKDVKYKLNDLQWIQEGFGISRGKLKTELDKLVRAGAVIRENEFYIFNDLL
ncbi:hypothetical protein [Lysinibacillus sphaericus]|uniref:hypothetical protein n=1 Tax=Lysinibacillus sphaericus TaxID=1421 RepID=UPI001A9FE719|nr:hypothetical protein [Lysinibacillus sphaericus]MEB7453245.1 hypothetical protein [Lysinibacillus sphaericus]QTB11734.1 hypothetical protein J2B92_12340 [Lysinibacillus sphaericus]